MAPLLHAQQEEYRLLAETATDLVCRCDLEGRYLYVSPSVEALLGYRPEELLGTLAADIVHPDDLDRARGQMADVLRAPGVFSVDCRMRRRDGAYVWVESTARTVAGPDGAMREIRSASRDITQRLQAAEELRRRLAQQSVVARLGERALGETDLDALIAEACALVAATLGVDLVFALEHLGRGRMQVRAGVGPWRDGFVGSQFEMRSFAAPGGPERYQRGPVVMPDLPGMPEWRAQPLRDHGVVSSANVVIGIREAPVGVLGAHSREPRTFTPEDLDFLSSVSHILGSAMARARVEEQIRHDALHDGLTGLPNRTLLLDRLRQALARAGRGARPLALLFLDLDNLKIFNDSLGHLAGDELLRAVAPRLRERLRPADTVARFAGDEFAVVCEDVDGERHALSIAQRLQKAFERPFVVQGEPRFVSASIGVVIAGPHGARDADELLSDGDAAMYRAKELGRGRTELSDAGLRARITERLRAEGDLRRALAGEGRLWVAYQPFFRLGDGRLAGVEALVRWEHPVRGSIAPVDFIGVAEESGLIVPLGELVLRTACSDAARLGIDVTVNVSARQVGSYELVEAVVSALEDTGLPPGSLGLEITEGLLLEESPATAQTLERLQALGVRLVLDDFGTGYSSLRYLQRHPLDVLKVDRSFVAGLGEDGRGDGAIVEAIVGMAQALGMRLIPEGVETAGQLRRLAALGCEFAQGFHLSHPLPAGELEALL